MAPSRAGSYLNLIPFVLLIWGKAAIGQQTEPFAGQGRSSSTSPVDVYVSASLDRLLAVDDREYTFTCIMFVILSWRDPQAVDMLVKRESEVRNGSTCTHFCNSSEMTTACCDSVWLPAIYFTNAKYFSEERLVYEVIQFDPFSNETGRGGGVQWIHRLLGTYSTPMEFRRFPFDSQRLRIEIESKDKNVVLHGSATGLETGVFSMSGGGDAVSGWRLKSLKLTVANSSSGVALRVNNSATLSSHDPLPYQSAEDGGQAGTKPASAAIVLEVDRVRSFFIVNMVVPIAFTVALSWSVFAINPKHLNTRITITVSLLFALVSLNFVITQQLPSSSYLTCIHWILIFSYVEIAAADVETLYVHYFLRKDSMERKQEWRLERSRADFKPQTVYGTLTPSGLVLSYNPAGAALDDLTMPSGTRTSGQPSRMPGRRDVGLGTMTYEEAMPLLQSVQSSDGINAPEGSSGQSERIFQSEGGVALPRGLEGASTSSRETRLPRSRSSPHGGSSGRGSSRLSSGKGRTSDGLDEGRSPLEHSASAPQDLVRKLMGELEQGLPSKEVVLATAIGLNEGRRSSGSLSRTHFANLKALKKKLPKKTMLQRLNSARQKIQEQATEEEVTEGVVVIDRACLVLFPIVYAVVLVSILQNFLSSPA